MIVLYIFLAIIFFIFLLMICPLYIKFYFTDSLCIKVKLLFFYFTLFPTKVKDNKDDSDKNDNKSLKEEQKVSKNKNKVLSIIKEKGISGFLKILKELVEIVLKSTKKVYNKMHIDYVNLFLIVSDDDAAKTAIRYAEVTSFLGMATSVLLNKVNIEKYNIKVCPGFNENQSKVNFYAKIHFFPISIIKIAIDTLYEFVKSFYKNQININLRKGVSK